MGETDIDDRKKRVTYILENERVQREIIRQKQATFLLIILLFLFSIFGHLILHFRLPTSILSAAGKILKINPGLDEEEL